MADITQDFIEFMKEYGIMGLALAVVIGTATKDLVSSLVDDMVMPVVEIFLPGGDWQTAVTVVGPVEFRTGHFLASALDFLIIAVLIYLFVRYALKKEEVEKI